MLCFFLALFIISFVRVLPLSHSSISLLLNVFASTFLPLWVSLARTIHIHCALQQQPQQPIHTSSYDTTVSGSARWHVHIAHAIVQAMSNRYDRTPQCFGRFHLFYFLICHDFARRLSLQSHFFISNSLAVFFRHAFECGSVIGCVYVLCRGKENYNSKQSGMGIRTICREITKISPICVHSFVAIFIILFVFT